MSDSVRAHRRQPTRLPRPWDSPGKNTGVGGDFLLQCVKVKSQSEVAQSCPTLNDPMDCSPPGSSILGFSRQEYWSGVPLPSPMTNLDSILKSRDITLSTKVHLVKAMIFPVVMYGCDSWTIKQAKHRKIDALELWSWRRLLRVPWTAKRSNQSILKEISPGCSFLLVIFAVFLNFLLLKLDAITFI